MPTPRRRISPYDDLIKKLDALKGQDGIEDQYIEYYKCYIAMMADKSIDTQLEFLLKMERNILRVS